MNGIIYLIYVREFLLQNIPIYKIGKTEDICARLKQYPKGSVLIYSCYSDNIKKSEDEIIELFSTKFKQRKDIGTESFEGDLKNMISFIHTIVNFDQSYQIQPIDKRNDRDTLEKYDKDKIFNENINKFVENDICDHPNNFLSYKSIMNLWNTRFPNFVLNHNNSSRVFQKHFGEIQMLNDKLGWHNKNFKVKIENSNNDEYKNSDWKEYIDKYLEKIDGKFLFCKRST